MIVVYLILLAIIQAVTEFLPVSSIGHLVCVGTVAGNRTMRQDFCWRQCFIWELQQQLSFCFEKNLKKTWSGTCWECLWILLGNVNLYIHNRTNR